MTASFRAALDEHLAALQARDVPRFAATLGDDVAVVDGQGRLTRGRDAVLHGHAEWFELADSWTFDYDVVFAREFNGAGLALIDVTYRHAPQSGAVRFVLSLVFARDGNGAWKFVYDQNTTLPPEPAD